MPTDIALEASLASVSILYQISSELSQVEDKATACTIFVESICRNFSIDLGILVELDGADGSYQAIAGLGLTKEEMNQFSGKVAGSVFDKTLQEARPVRLASPKAGILPEIISHFSIQSVLLMPIASKQGSGYVLLCCRLYDKEFLFADERVIGILATKLSSTLDTIVSQDNLAYAEQKLQDQVLEVQKLNLALADEKADVERQVVERTQQLFEEHVRFQSSIDSLDVGLLMTFKDSQTISHNAALSKILGLSNTVKIDVALLEEKLLTSSFDLMKAIENCQTTGELFNISEVDYGDHILSVFGAPVRTQDHNIIGTVILIEDITEAKIMARSKDEFFSIASHELRTPLTSIRGNSSMILDYYKDLLIKDTPLKEMVEDVYGSAVRLIEIVNDFLDLSRLEQGKMVFTYSPVSLQTVIESVVQEMQVVFRDKNLYLKMDDPTFDSLPKVWADEDRLKQVVYNLIGNAAKFTDNGGITLKAQVMGTLIKVLVIDTGRGMTPESQQLLFRKFQQASSSLLTRDSTRGTGLGLYISKMMVASMGGTIALEESTEDQGSVFSFTIPIATAETPAIIVHQSTKHMAHLSRR